MQILCSRVPIRAIARIRAGCGRTEVRSAIVPVALSLLCRFGAGRERERERSPEIWFTTQLKRHSQRTPARQATSEPWPQSAQTERERERERKRANCCMLLFYYLLLPAMGLWCIIGRAALLYLKAIQIASLPAATSFSCSCKARLAF